MKKLRTIFLGLSLAMIVLAGSFYAWNNVFTPRKKSPSGHSGHSHSHANLEPVEANRPFPTLEISLKHEGEDRVLYLETTNFSFKSAVDTKVTGPNKGHAHLNINGESYAMFYANRYVLPDFMPGTYTLKVTLNESGSHAPIAVKGNVVSDTILLNVKSRQKTTSKP